jgi:hypothetical protein
MQNKKSLYVITIELRMLMQNSFDDISESEQKHLIDTLSNELKEKTDSVASYCRMLEHQIMAAKDEYDRIKKILDQRKNRLDKFKEYLVVCMDVLQESKLTGETSSIALRKPSKVVSIYDETLIPPQYLLEKKTVSVDKASIKEMLKNGHEIKGARLEDGKRSVNVK